MQVFVRLIFLIFVACDFSWGNVNIFSVNVNTYDGAVDSNGIFFARDENVYEIKFCGSKTLLNAPDDDKKLYDTENFRKEFDYDVPLDGDGNYTVVMKFADCYHSTENERIFNIYLNQHQVYSHIDLIKLTGANTAITMHMYFSVCKNTVYYDGLKIKQIAGKVNIRFVPVKHKAILNAMVVFRGSIENLPSSLLHTTKIKKPPGFYQCPSINNNNKNNNNNQSDISHSDNNRMINNHNSSVIINNYYYACSTDNNKVNYQISPDEL
jgi:hypothetical protein